MKKITIACYLSVLFSFTAISQTKNFIDQPYIEVVGNADSSVTPNEIFIKIIISERDSRDRIPVEETETKMIAGFKDMGINIETNLVTSDILSNYKFYLLKQKDILKSKEYTLKVADAATASKVFIKLEDLGISNASVERINHTELENIRNICRTKAIENAKLKAFALTRPIGQIPGNAIHIIDIDLNTPNSLQGRVSGVQVRGYSYDKAKYEPPKIEFEKIQVMATVSAKFILK